MKLSKAIREGARRRPQAFGVYATADGRTCALGAAFEALTGLLPVSGKFGVPLPHDPDLEATWLTWMGAVVVTPDGPTSARLAVLTLNDDKYWTREQIADWLEGQGL